MHLRQLKVTNKVAQPFQSGTSTLRWLFFYIYFGYLVSVNRDEIDSSYDRMRKNFHIFDNYLIFSPFFCFFQLKLFKPVRI